MAPRHGQNMHQCKYTVNALVHKYFEEFPPVLDSRFGNRELCSPPDWMDIQ